MFADHLSNQYWAPTAFRDLERMVDELQRAFTHGLGRASWRDGSHAPVNVWANDDAIAVTAELPGVDPASVSVGLAGDTLTIQAKRAASTTSPLDSTSTEKTAAGAKAEAVTWHRREREAYDLSRTIGLPYHVDPASVEARLKNGILTVALRRAEADKPRRITVQAA